MIGVGSSCVAPKQAEFVSERRQGRGKESLTGLGFCKRNGR